MAIDSTAKKASLINLGTPWLVIGPILDGTFGTAEQQHLLHLYTGIAAAAPSAPLAGPTLQFTIVYPGMRFTVARSGLDYTIRYPQIRATVGG